MQNLFQEIYGRPAEQWELENIAGLPEDQVRSVLEQSISNWNQSNAQPVSNRNEDYWTVTGQTPDFVISSYNGPAAQSSGTIPDGISDGVLGWLGFPSREAYRQSMAEAEAFRANDTSPFVTGGGAPASTTSAPQASAPASAPVQFVTGPGPNPVQQLTGAASSSPALASSVGYSATPQRVGATGSGMGNVGGGNYNSELIRSLRMASAGQQPFSNPGVNMLANQSYNTGGGGMQMPAAPSGGLAFNPQPTVLEAYDPSGIFREIYGRDPIPSELDNTRGMNPADLRSTLERSLAEWQAAQSGSKQPPQQDINYNYNYSDA